MPYVKRCRRANYTEVSDILFNCLEAEALLQRKRETSIRAGTRLDRKFLEWCRTTCFSATEILSLFEKGNDDRPGPRYKCDVQCPVCETWRIQNLGMSGVRELISVARRKEAVEFDFKFWCDECEEAARQKRETERQFHSNEELFTRMRVEAEKKRKDRAEYIVSRCLSLTHHWRDDFPQEKRFEMLTHEQFDAEIVAAAIRRMPWADFFKTAYWEAVHDEVLRRIREKCMVCAGPGPLRVHYRTNDLHGFEHTEAGMRELLFLCKHCELTSALKTKLDSN